MSDGPETPTQQFLKALREKRQAEEVALSPTEGDFQQSNEEYDELEKEQRETELQSRKDDLKARRRYINWVFILIVSWLIFVAVVVVLDGRADRASRVKFDLTDGVLIALITTTTINVIGLFLIILRYLFPSQNS